MSSTTPANKAKNWALWTIVLVAISNISVFMKMGAVEFFARTIIVGGIFAAIVFFIVWAFMSFKEKSKSE
jgi:polyferredoxin